MKMTADYSEAWQWWGQLSCHPRSRISDIMNRLSPLIFVLSQLSYFVDPKTSPVSIRPVCILFVVGLWYVLPTCI